ncbi:hypothetical protein CCP3SC15_500024 [Gammaproteobacteria bacterium]
MIPPDMTQPDTVATDNEMSLPSLRPLAFLFGLAALIIFAAAYLAFDAQQRDIRTHAEQNLANIAILKAGQIRLWLKERRDDAAVFSDRTPFAERFDNWLRHGAKDDDDRRLMQSRMDIILNTQNYQALLLFDPQGQVRLSMPEPVNVDDRDRQLVFDAMRTQQVRIDDIHISAAHQPAMGLVAPMLVGEGKDSRVVGVLYFRIDPTRFLYPLIESWPIESQTAETLLARRDGDEVLFLNRLRHFNAAPLSFRAPLAALELPAAQGLRGKTGFTSGKDYRGENVVGYLLHIPETDWAMVAKIDEAEIYAPIRRLAFW